MVRVIVFNVAPAGNDNAPIMRGLQPVAIARRFA